MIVIISVITTLDHIGVNRYHNRSSWV